MFRPSRRRAPVAAPALVLLLAVPVLSLTTSAAAGTAGTAGSDPGPVEHRPPVAAPVADPFRAPATPFGPGNRGLEYGTEAGAAVVASAAGEVVFAGQVGGALHVTVRHADGVRTSYSFLAEVQVVVGQRLQGGDRVGLAGERLHFGARLGDEYFDPASLFGVREAGVELVPFEVPPGSTPEGERVALALTAFRGDGGWAPDLPDLGSVRDWLGERATALSHYMAEAHPTRWVTDTAWTVANRLLLPGPCSGSSTPVEPPGADRTAVTVGGLGSTSGSASIDRLDLDRLGYTPDDVVRFSYAGGHTPGTGGPGGLPGVEVTSYGSEDTQGDLRAAGVRLADLVEAAARARPGAEVDLYAHSMGGVVARVALLELQRRGFPLDRLGVVATLGSPHRGADLATLVRSAEASLAGRHGLDLVEGVVRTGLAPDSAAVSQLAETSDLVGELADDGVPEGVELVSVAARGDLVVPLARTRVAGARNVTVPGEGWGAHGAVVGADETARELSLALAGLPPRCVGAWDVLRDETTGRGIALMQTTVGAATTGLP